MAGKKKILIVEDHVEIRGLMARFLKRAGYEVIEAETGLTAIERANATHPDLITIDLGLPDITGDKVVARLKAVDESSWSADSPGTSARKLPAHDIVFDGQSSSVSEASNGANKWAQGSCGALNGYFDLILSL